MVFPKDPKGFAIDDQFYVGASGLLVKPVTAGGQNQVDIYLSDDEVDRPYSALLCDLNFTFVSHITITSIMNCTAEQMRKLQRLLRSFLSLYEEALLFLPSSGRVARRRS